MVLSDFFSVDTVFLRRFYVLLYMELATRRIAWYAVSDRPDATWVTQQARNLVWQLADGGGQARFLVHDHTPSTSCPATPCFWRKASG